MAAKRDAREAERVAQLQRRQSRVLHFNQSIQAFLSKSGCDESELMAQLWEFTPTHSALMFKLSFPSFEKAIYLVCLVSVELNSLIQWKGARIKAELRGDLCEVTDESGCLKVLCCDLDVVERESYLGL